MKKVVCIGNVSYDISFLVDDYPIENFKYRVDEKIENGGGPASNAAYLLGKWGLDVTFIGSLGKDSFGEKIVQEFKDVNVNTEFIQFHDLETTLAILIINTQTGTRTILSYRDPNLKYTNELSIKADYILIDGQEYEISKKIIEENPNAISVIDAGRNTENVLELAKMVDYVVCSKEFAENFINFEIDIENKELIKNAFDIMEKSFKNVVITLEKNGCLYKKDGLIYLMPSIKVEQKDSTGAGDYYHGAFVYGLVKEFPIDKITRFSNITGAISVTRIGVRNSCPTLEEVEEKYNV